MTFIDFFAGIGGVRLGLELAGMECVGWCENDKYARLSYEAMFDTDGEWSAWDIREVEPTDLPKADLWAFGFPCQDISVAGYREGLNGKRSGLFHEIIRLLEGASPEDRPQWLLCENVRNLLSIDGGRGFTEVLSEMAKVGYDAEWCCLNSMDFGVAQSRERVFIVARSNKASGRS